MNVNSIVVIVGALFLSIFTYVFIPQWKAEDSFRVFGAWLAISLWMEFLYRVAMRID